MITAKAFGQAASDKRWVQLTGAMDGLRQDMKTLAPHPQTGGRAEMPNKVAAGNSRDSMFASLLIDCFFGAGINAGLCDALNLPEQMKSFDVVNAIDLYDEYWTDRQNDKAGQQKNRTTGGYELGEKGAICGGFNTTVRTAKRTPDAWDLYFTDLSGRRALEQNMAGIARQMDMIQMEYRTKPQKPAFSM